MFKLRIKFSKHGPLIYVGHLDMMRYFQKAMRRAEVDIAYSAGFSPHQIMSFAAPLGVGLCSNGEYFDIGAESLTSGAQLRQALNEQMAEGIEILSVKRLPDSAGNAMASVAAAGYTVGFREGHEPDFDLFSQLPSYLEQSQIPVVKATKKITKEFDLKEYLYELTWDKDAHTMYMLVSASSAQNIKPAFVMENIYAYCGHTPGEFDFVITREETYTNAGNQESPAFVPLDSVGEEY